MTLHGALDDATGAVLALHFRPTEDLHGYAMLFAQVFATHGLPVACYGDGTAILVRTDAHWSLDEELRGAQDPTHLGRVLAELGIGYIRAHSPQEGPHRAAVAHAAGSAPRGVALARHPHPRGGERGPARFPRGLQSPVRPCAHRSDPGVAPPAPRPRPAAQLSLRPDRGAG